MGTVIGVYSIIDSKFIVYTMHDIHHVKESVHTPDTIMSHKGFCRSPPGTWNKNRWLDRRLDCLYLQQGFSFLGNTISPIFGISISPVFEIHIVRGKALHCNISKFRLPSGRVYGGVSPWQWVVFTSYDTLHNVCTQSLLSHECVVTVYIYGNAPSEVPCSA